METIILILLIVFVIWNLAVILSMTIALLTEMKKTSLTNKHKKEGKTFVYPIDLSKIKLNKADLSEAKLEHLTLNLKDK